MSYPKEKYNYQIQTFWACSYAQAVVVVHRQSHVAASEPPRAAFKSVSGAIVARKFCPATNLGENKSDGNPHENKEYEKLPRVIEVQHLNSGYSHKRHKHA